MRMRVYGRGWLRKVTSEDGGGWGGECGGGCVRRIVTMTFTKQLVQEYKRIGYNESWV